MMNPSENKKRNLPSKSYGSSLDALIVVIKHKD